jgi:predicted amidohydrolase
MPNTVRIGSANTGSSFLKANTVDCRLSAEDALNKVDRTIGELEDLVHKAGEAGCDVLAFTELVLALSTWQVANPERVPEVLPQANERMLTRLGAAAASHRMYLLCCSDEVDSTGAIRNTSWFLGRNGKEIGRYYKVNLPVHEQRKVAGTGFPVFRTPDLGGVGVLVCYDLVFPETARCLALNGADIIFHLTQGGAAFGGDDISRAAFRTRAAENFTYLVVSWGGWGATTGSMVIAPNGDIIAEENRAYEIAIADIDPFGGRECADWANRQPDMRARVFRERRPEVYGVLADPEPPVLRDLPDMVPGGPAVIADINRRATTVGHGEFRQAEEHLEAGRIDEAVEAFERLTQEYPESWFDRTARERLEGIRRAGQGK